jgi:lipopolysaccharide biosynthesis regulator YciM
LLERSAERRIVLPLAVRARPFVRATGRLRCRAEKLDQAVPTGFKKEWCQRRPMGLLDSLKGIFGNDLEPDPEFRCIKCGADLQRDHYECPECGAPYVAATED